MSDNSSISERGKEVVCVAQALAKECNDQDLRQITLEFFQNGFNGALQAKIKIVRG